jgi:hypothetical protein
VGRDESVDGGVVANGSARPKAEARLFKLPAAKQTFRDGKLALRFSSANYTPSMAFTNSSEPETQPNKASMDKRDAA